MSSLAVIILTYNEEIHIERCIRSIKEIAEKILVVDSYSTDSTSELARSLGADVVEHEFVNQAKQINWTLEAIPIKEEWVLRIDADEILSEELIEEISRILNNPQQVLNGFMLNRCTYFQGKAIRHGGQFPQYVLRLWRNGKARCEHAWMDEHMVLSEGEAARIARGELIDNNLNSLQWWIEKHNRYSTREAISILNKKYSFLETDIAAKSLSGQARTRRWLKDNLYLALPLRWRAMAFYLYRMVFRLGILDGRTGRAFHFLQGYWYRYLVDLKTEEIESLMKKEGIDCAEAIRRKFEIDPVAK